MWYNKVQLICLITTKTLFLIILRRKFKSLFDEINLVTFAKFKGDTSADWWNAHNLFKHNSGETGKDGIINYKRANLKNILSALSALLILLSKKMELCANFSAEVESTLFEIDFIK